MPIGKVNPQVVEPVSILNRTNSDPANVTVGEKVGKLNGKHVTFSDRVEIKVGADYDRKANSLTNKDFDKAWLEAESPEGKEEIEKLNLEDGIVQSLLALRAK